MTDNGDERSALERAGAHTTLTSLSLPASGISWEEYENLGRFLGAMSVAMCWWIGDFLNYGAQVFGEEEYAQIEASLRLRPQTLANYQSVAKHIPVSRRRAGLSFGVHAEVAYLPPRERDEMLAIAYQHDWKREHVREHMQRKRAVELETGQNVKPSEILALPPAPRPKCPHCGGELL